MSSLINSSEQLSQKISGGQWFEFVKNFQSSEYYIQFCDKEVYFSQKRNNLLFIEFFNVIH